MEYSCQVVALTIDIGQTADDLNAIKQKAITLGAVEAVVYDAKEEFADTLLSEAIKANADYQGGYALGCPLGRVMISQIAARVAAEYKCQVVAHGCTGKGNDQVRFEGYILTLDPSLKIIAPVREWGMGREEEIEYAAQHNIPVKQKKDSPYSYDENMWSNTGEGGEIENPELTPNVAAILQWCKPITAAADTPQSLNIDFVKGVPTALDGVQMPLWKLVMTANSIGANHGVGVFQLIEDRIVGLKVRGVYENPGASILIAAHKKLQYLVSTREENEFSTLVDQKWAYLTYGAKWYTTYLTHINTITPAHTRSILLTASLVRLSLYRFDPLMSHLRAYINDQNTKVTGRVTVQLFKGNITVTSLTSPYSLFNHNLATFNRNASFNQNASSGFIELYTLAMRTAHGLKDGVKELKPELATSRQSDVSAVEK